MIRHQLIILCRKLRGRIRLTNSDHWFLIQRYARYYNEIRTHQSLDKDASISRPVQSTGSTNRSPSLADRATTMLEFKFSVCTGLG